MASSVAKEMALYGLVATTQGGQVIVKGPDEKGELVQYYAGEPGSLKLFWREFRKELGALQRVHMSKQRS